MLDATLSQGNRLLGLILREQNPHRFAQRLIENWGVVQAIGRGVFTREAIRDALRYMASLPEKERYIDLLGEIVCEIGRRRLTNERKT